MSNNYEWDDIKDNYGRTKKDAVDVDYPDIKRPCIIDCRDSLNNLVDLLEVCIIALTNDEWKNQVFMERNVAHVLKFFVIDNLKKIEKELGEV